MSAETLTVRIGGRAASCAAFSLISAALMLTGPLPGPPDSPDAASDIIAPCADGPVQTRPRSGSLGRGTCALPTGPFAVVYFDDGPLGVQLAVLNLGGMGNPVCGGWGIMERTWQDDDWAADVRSVAWTGDGLQLFVASGGVYGSDAVFHLDLFNRKARRIFPSEATGREYLAIQQDLDLLITGVSVEPRRLTVTTQVGTDPAPITWSVPW